MIAFGSDADQGKASGADRDLFSFREELDIAAGDDDAGMFVAQHQALAGKQFSPDNAAFNAGIACEEKYSIERNKKQKIRRLCLISGGKTGILRERLPAR